MDNNLFNNSDFVKNLKRMFIVKEIESKNIKTFIINYDETTKTICFEMDSHENNYEYKYKIKRRNRKNGINGKSKKVRINKKDINKKDDETDNIIAEKINNNNLNIISCETVDRESVNNGNLDKISNEVINNEIDIQRNNSKIFDGDSGSIEYKKTKKEIIKEIQNILELYQKTIKLLSHVYNVTNSMNPKKAIVELNKLANTFKESVEDAGIIEKINDRLIILIDKI